MNPVMEIINGKITVDFMRETDGGLSTKSNKIYTSMLGNTNFPNPVPDMPTVLQAINSYNDARAAARNSDRVAVAIKKQEKIALITLLKSLGTYVTFTAQGNVAMLASSGFTLAKTRGRAPAVDAATNVQLNDGANPGELTSSCDGVKNAKTYVHQYKPVVANGDTDWITYFTTSRACTFTGLTTGQKYMSRIGVIGANNQVVFSDTVTRIAQ